MTAPLTIRLHPADNVVVARMDILPGTKVEGEVAAATRVPPGHKILTRAVKKGEPLRKYNQIIGFATEDLAPGTHIHTHNCVMGDFERDYAFCADAHPTDYITPPATFQGYRRADGRAATRNYIGIVTTVNCSAATSRMIARHIEPLLAQFPNIDGVVPLTHGGGCGMAASGLEMDVLRRTLAGYTRHPNMAAVVVLGLGCETNQISGLMTAEGLKEGPKLIPDGDPGRGRRLQDRDARRRLPEGAAARGQRREARADPGQRADPGAAVRRLGRLFRHLGQPGAGRGGRSAGAQRRHGGAVGDAGDLRRRASADAPCRQPRGRREDRRAHQWWEEHCARTGGEMNNNPSPGNKAGGLTTILEKSLGAVAKGGTTNLVDVYKYAEPITAKGSSTWTRPATTRCPPPARWPGGANVLCFTTGRGSVFGCKPTPVTQACDE